MDGLDQALQTLPNPRRAEKAAPKMQILVIGKAPSIIEPLHRYLKDLDYEISLAPNEESGLHAISLRLPDLVFLELIQPELYGFEICKRLKADERSRSIPVIFIADELSAEEIVNGFSIGGADYLVKPFGRAEVQSRTRAHLEIQKLRREKDELIRQLRISSKTDPLTGLPNRQSMEDRLQREQFHFHRYQRPFSLIYGDIDAFKKVQDSYGHEAEEMALLHVAKILSENSRRTDYVCRWGGDEFMIVLPETNGDGALVLAEKLRRLIYDQPFMSNFKKISLRMSFGIGVHADKNLDAAQAIQCAEKCVRLAKERGRNRVMASLKRDI